MDSDGRSQRPHCRALVLGPFELSCDGEQVEVGGWPRRSVSLLRLLLTSGDGRRLRDDLLEVFWPDSAPDAAASNLRSALHRLRVPVGGDDMPLTRSERGWVMLNPAFHWEVDLDEFESAARMPDDDPAALERALALYRGEPLIEDRYADWATPARAHIQRLRRELCLRLSRSYQTLGSLDTAAQWTERVLEVDRLDEEALQLLLALLGELGRRTEALRRFQEFEQHLAKEMDLSPSAETLTLVDRLKSRIDLPVAPASRVPHAVSQGSPEYKKVTSEVRTFLIADVRGYTQFTEEHGDEAAARLAMRFTALMADTAREHEGQTIELRGDEAVTAFASARQALRAAVAAQQRFAAVCAEDPSLLLEVGIGLDAGEAVPVGEHGYRGGALNLAARLCGAAAGGEILASEAVVHLARTVEGLTYVERGPIALKGFRSGVKAIQVVMIPESADTTSPAPSLPAGPRLPAGGFLGALPSGPLVARKMETDSILTLVTEVEEDEGRLVLLAGEPGVGKTRLAQEVTVHLREHGFLLATGRCYESRQTTPFYPFLDVLAMLYDALPGELRDEVPQRWPYLQRLLPQQSAAMVGESLSAVDERERLFWTVTGFLQTLATRSPVALLLDDLHWADESSLELLQHLARHTRSHPILLLGTYRDVEVQRQHPLEAALRDLHREQLLERIVLRRLSEEATISLMTLTLGEGDLPPELATLIHRQTEGNPFFVQQVVQVLLERGDLYRENGHWTRRSMGEIDVPESVRSVIGQRLARLSEDAQGVLQEASILGHVFRFDDLLAMGGRAEFDLEKALDEAVTLGLVRPLGKDDYAFDHALTQQALVTELSHRRRRRLHLAAGETLERLSEAKRATRAAELAWHFLQADEAGRALRYAVMAGDRAEEVFAHAEAEAQYRTALELARESNDWEREAEALEKLGRVLRFGGQLDEALHVLGEAASIYHAADDLHAESRAVALMATPYYLQGRPEVAVARSRPLLEQLEGEAPSHTLAQLCAALIWNMPNGERLAVADKAADLARTLGDERLLATVDGPRGGLLVGTGRVDEGRQVMEEVLPLAEKLGDLYSLGEALEGLGNSYADAGELERSKGYYERGLEAYEQLGDRLRTVHEAFRLGSVHFHLGDWREARRYYEHALTSVQGLESSWLSPYPSIDMGKLELAEGNWEQAARYLEQGAALAERTTEIGARRQVLTLLAERDLFEGHPDEALARLERGLAEFATAAYAESGPTDFLQALAEARLEVGDDRGAEGIVEAGVSEASEQGAPLSRVHWLRLQGQIAASRGAWSEAERAFREGVALARHIRYPYGEARLLHELGRMQLKEGERSAAERSFREALAIFERLGARPYIERVQQVLTAMG